MNRISKKLENLIDNNNNVSFEKKIKKKEFYKLTENDNEQK